MIRFPVADISPGVGMIRFPVADISPLLAMYRPRQRTRSSGTPNWRHVLPFTSLRIAPHLTVLASPPLQTAVASCGNGIEIPIAAPR